MNSSEAADLANLLGKLYAQYGEWSDDRKSVFAAAIVDLPAESAKKAVVQWARTAKKPPLPGDIREIAQQMPVERALPAPDDIPRRHPGQGISTSTVFVASDWDRKRMIAQYAENIRRGGYRVNRPDIAHEARRLGQDASAFECERGPMPAHRDGMSLSDLAEGVLAARKFDS